MNEQDDWLDEAFGEVFPAHVSAFTDFMIELRRDFDGDLDMMVVLAVIGDRRFSRRIPGGALTKVRLGTTPVLDNDGVSINALSIAQYTGISRETVRRKVSAMIERGWVERDEQGDLRPTKKAAKDLTNATNASLTYLRKIVEACDKARAK